MANEAPKPPTIEPASIFSHDEKTDIIKGFIRAWLGQQVDIQFPDAQELIEKSKLEKTKIDYPEAYRQEREGKRRFLNEISICSGGEASTPEQFRTAVHDLFIHILMYRSGHRIKGEFTTYSTEQRISRVEQGLQVTNNLVKQILDWLQSGSST